MSPRSSFFSSSPLFCSPQNEFLQSKSPPVASPIECSLHLKCPTPPFKAPSSRSTKGLLRLLSRRVDCLLFISVGARCAVLQPVFFFGLIPSLSNFPPRPRARNELLAFRLELFFFLVLPVWPFFPPSLKCFFPMVSVPLFPPIVRYFRRSSRTL